MGNGIFARSPSNHVTVVKQAIKMAVAGVAPWVTLVGSAITSKMVTIRTRTFRNDILDLRSINYTRGVLHTGSTDPL
jgi:hypothetical protein